MVKSTGAKVEGRALRESANDKRYISSTSIVVLVIIALRKSATGKLGCQT